MTGRVLVLSPDAEVAALLAGVLERLDADWLRCTTGQALLIEMDRGAAVAIVAQDALVEEDRPALLRWLSAQPSWADFPFIVIGASSGKAARATFGDTVAALGNVVMLEQPVHPDTLTSAIAVALRARDRQYEARQQWVARENNERRLRIALLAAGLGAWNIDLSDRSLTASDRFKAHFGREPDAPLTALDVLTSIHPEDRDLFRAAAQAAVQEQKDLLIESRVTWPDGTVRWLQISGRTIFGDDGRPITVSGVTLDVTLRHETNEDLQRRVAEAVEQSQRAQMALVQAQKMEAVGQLTGGIAHDFNNLLTAIMGNIDLISRRTLDEKIKVMAGRARHAAERAAKLTGQLLAFSRSQRLDLKPVEVDKLIAGMRDLTARTIGPTITVTASLGAPGQAVLADGNQLELALLNLAINARDAMPSGGDLSIRTRAEPSDDARGGWIVIAVTDNGSGIPADVLPRVFDPFFTTKPIGKGTGLGLSQVHGIAHQSGGSVRIASTVGAGTTVEIWLREIGARAPLAAEDEDEDDALVMGHGRVLVVDDDADVRRFVVTCLETLGFGVAEADGGASGLDHIAAERFDLMIVDFAMPGLNGAEVASAARKVQPSLPIILATGYADTQQVETAFAPDEILRKPFRLHELSRAVRHALTEADKSV